MMGIKKRFGRRALVAAACALVACLCAGAAFATGEAGNGRLAVNDVSAEASDRSAAAPVSDGASADVDGVSPDQEAEASEPASGPVAASFTNAAPLVPSAASAPFAMRLAAPAATLASDGVEGDADGGSDQAGSGLQLSKTAVYDEEADDYTITLEAYATGSRYRVPGQAKPCDIVLVLDQSGSMNNCIVCGGTGGSHTVGYTYEETYDVAQRNNTYFVEDEDGGYVGVSYCSGSHRRLWSSYECEGGAGWYTGTDAAQHTEASRMTPKAAADASDGVQFYTRSAITESCTSRLDSLKTAVGSFVGSVEESAKGADGEYGTADDVRHRVAVVGFGSDERGNTHYQNTELFVGSAEYGYNSGSISSQYGNALQDVTTEEGRNNAAASVGKLTAGGGTATDLGTGMANEVLDAYKDEADAGNRQKVVVVFTDGVPGIKDDDSDSTRKGYADRAIGNTKVSKDTYGATVYTVGVFAGADAGNPGTLTSSTSWSDDAVANKFMHLMSSNYPEASSMTNAGAVDPNLGSDSYYLSAGDSASLNGIFEAIADRIDGGSSSTLGSEAVVRDLVSDQFRLPEGAAADGVEIRTYRCTGVDEDGGYAWIENADAMGASATVDADDGEVSVAGFDFSENWVGEDATGETPSYHGSKLVIEFKVEAKEGFLGGNDVYTNASAGVYASSSETEPVQEFERPTVNVPIKDVTVTAPDKNVYLTQVPGESDLRSGVTVKCGTVDITDPDKLEGWQKAYVDITGPAVALPAGYDATDDATYTVTATVSPKTDGATSTEGTAATAEAGIGTGGINVFKPELTYEDSEVWYGGDAPASYDGNLAKTEWKHGTASDSSTDMIGTAPTLDLAYVPETGKISDDDKIASKDDVAVDATAKIGAADVTGKTTFKHADCAGKTCGKPDAGRFWLHVRTCSLTVSKAFETGSEPEPGEAFVFTVEGGGVPVDVEVALCADARGEVAPVTVSGLPVGSYAVAEDGNWSWRYTQTTATGLADGKIELSSQASEGAVTFTNRKTDGGWLDFSGWCRNLFKGSGVYDGVGVGEVTGGAARPAAQAS